MADNGDAERDNPGGRTPGGGWVPVPDPTQLTTDAVERATDLFRRETQSLRDTLETRMRAADEDRARVWERLRDLPTLYEAFTNHLRDELIERDTHDRELVDQRLVSIDKATELLAGETARVLADAEKGDKQTSAEMHTMVTALQQLTEQRLGAMDLATKVLADSIEKFPTDVDRAVANVREVLTGDIRRVQSVTEEKFTAIDGTFSSNALALTAALAAQKEAAAEQNKSNTLAITKSESSTKETIAANAVQAQTGLASLENQFDDIKERVVRIESAGVGRTSVTGTPFDAATMAQDARIAQDARQRAALAIVISSILALVAIASLIFAIVKK